MKWIATNLALILAAYSFAAWHAKLIAQDVPIPHSRFAAVWFIVGSAAAWFLSEFIAVALLFDGVAARWQAVALELVVFVAWTVANFALFSFNFRRWLNKRRKLSKYYLGEEIDDAPVRRAVLFACSVFEAWRFLARQYPKRSKYDLFFHAYAINKTIGRPAGKIVINFELCVWITGTLLALLLQRFVLC